MDPQEKLFQILDSGNAFPLNAYTAVHKGLDFTLRLKKEQGHVTGQELAIGMAGYLNAEYGPFARLVLQGWGVESTYDFGRLVFHLVEAGLMRKQETDAIGDFLDVYDFDEVFPTGFDWLQDVRQEFGLGVNKPGRSAETSS